LDNTEAKVSYDLSIDGKKSIISPYEDDERDNFLLIFRILEILYFILNIVIIILYVGNFVSGGMVFFSYVQILGMFLYLD